MLALLCQHKAYQRVIAITRSKSWGADEGKVDWVKLPPKPDAESIDNLLPKGNDFFSCLGTTRKNAGSSEAFEAIDYDLNYAFAKTALSKGYTQYFLVSAVGADPTSSFLYTRVKGKLELDIKALPFWSIHLFQPGILLGERNENRFGESLAKPLFKGLDWLTRGVLGKYRPIEAEAVANSMVEAAQKMEGGIYTYSGNHLFELAESYYNDKA